MTSDELPTPRLPKPNMGVPGLPHPDDDVSVPKPPSRMPPPPPPPPPPKGKGKGKKGKGKKGKGKVVRAPFLTQAARASARPSSPHARLSPSPPLLDCSQPPAPPPPPPAPTAKPCVLLSAADIAHAEKVERKEARIREEIECDEKLTTFFNTGAQKNAPRSAASSLFTTSPPLSPPPSCLPAVMETGMTPAEMIAYFEVNAPHMSADIIAHLQRLGLLPYPEAEAAAAVDVGAAAATVEEEEEAAAADDLPEAKRLKPIAEAVAAEVDEAEGGAEGMAAAAAPVAGDADGEVEAGADAEADAEGEAEAEGVAAAAAAAADEFDALQCGMCAEEAPVKLSRECAHCVFSGGESIEAMLAHSLAGEGDGDGDRSEPLGPPIPDEPDSLGLRLGEVVGVHSLVTEAEHNGNTGLVRAQAPSNPRPTHPRPWPPLPPSSHLTPASSPFTRAARACRCCAGRRRAGATSSSSSTAPSCSRSSPPTSAGRSTSLQPAAAVPPARPRLTTTPTTSRRSSAASSRWSQRSPSPAAAPSSRPSAPTSSGRVSLTTRRLRSPTS